MLYMDEHHNNDDQNNSHDGDQNHSEQDQNDSEQSSDNHENSSEHVPEQEQNSSESDPNRSEHERELIPNLFGTESAEQHRTAPNCSEEMGDHRITVREAARIFEEAGVPRTERAITKWCNQNARGITRLECCYNDPERKYYITPQSINEVIKEERHKNQYTEFRSDNTFSTAAENLSKTVRNEHQNSSEQEQNSSERNQDGSEHEQNSSEQVRNDQQNRSEEVQTNEHSPRSESDYNSSGNREDEKKIKELEIENYNLKVQVEGQKYLMGKYDELMEGERKRHENEKLALVDRLTDARHQIGTLEEKLLQIEAPGKDNRREPIDAEAHEQGEGNNDHQEGDNHENENGDQPHEGEWHG